DAREAHRLVVTLLELGDLFVRGGVALEVRHEIFRLEALPDRARRLLKLKAHGHLFPQVREIARAPVHVAERASAPALFRAESSVARGAGAPARDREFIGLRTIAADEAVAVGGEWRVHGHR